MVRVGNQDVLRGGFRATAMHAGHHEVDHISGFTLVGSMSPRYLVNSVARSPVCDKGSDAASPRSVGGQLVAVVVIVIAVETGRRTTR